MTFLSGLFQRNPVVFKLPSKTLDCLQYLLDAGYTPKFTTATESYNINHLEVLRSGHNLEDDSPILIMVPTKEERYILNDLRPRTGFDFDSKNRIKNPLLERVHNTRGGQQITLTNPQDKFDTLGFVLYPEMTTPNNRYNLRGTFEIDKNRRVNQVS